MKISKFLTIMAVLITAVFLFSACDADKLISESAPVGVYVGIVSFAHDTSTYNPQPVKDLVDLSDSDNTLTSKSLTHLTDESIGDLKTKALSLYTAGSTSSTPIYYAVDYVIRDLKKVESTLSHKLDNVTIVSFTDGFEQGSADFSNAIFNTKYTNAAQYGTYINNRINEVKIKKVSLDAYAVAVKNNQDASGQQTTLKNISSGSNGNYVIADSWTNNISDIFTNLANSLTSVKYIGSLTITVTGPTTVATYQAGQNFCVTFDGQAPASSNKWLKGRVVDNNGKWEIQSITFASGISAGLTNNTAYESNRRGINVSFGFPGMSGISNTNTIKQYYTSNGSTWTHLEGGDASSNYTFAQKEQKSAIVYLILDATLDSGNINTIRTAAGNFIDTLYNESKAK